MTSLSSMRIFKRKTIIALVVVTLLTLQIRTFLQVHHHDDGVGVTRDDDAHIAVPNPSADIRENDNNDNAHLLLQSYDPALYPVMSTKKSAPLRVAIVTINPLRGEAMHFLYDGVMHSSHLSLAGLVSLYGGDINNVTTYEGKVVPIASSSNFTNVDLWLVDGQHVAKLTNRPLWKEILNPNANHSVLFVDFSDRFSFQRRHYAKLGVWKMMETHSKVRLAVRSIVEGRMFDAEQKAIHPAGHVTPNPYGILHFPYAVRSDIVHAMFQELRSKHPNHASWSSIASPAYADDAESLETIQQMLFDATIIPRTMHVYHPWHVTTKKGQSELRNSVSRLVRSWNGISLSGLGDSEETTTKTTNANMQQHQQIVLSTSIQEAGARMDQGRNSVDPSYIRALMQAKIVIVAQRDGWEDHYRLFEAMMCGPLVISDRMIAPPKGIVDGETVVFFDNFTHLQQRVHYFLTHDKEREQIAKAGWMLAATQHRSWHRLEEMLL